MAGGRLPPSGHQGAFRRGVHPRGAVLPASGRVYAVLASKETVTGPLTIQYRTATGGVGEAQVAWVVEPLRGTRRIRVTREEIRLRLTASPLTVVVSADHIEVESAPQRFPTGQRLAEPGEPGRLRPEPGRPGGPHQPRPSTGSSTRSRNSCGFRRAPPRGLDGACLACHQNDDLECVAGAFTGFGYVGIAGQPRHIRANARRLFPVMSRRAWVGG